LPEQVYGFPAAGSEPAHRCRRGRRPGPPRSRGPACRQLMP